MNRLTKWFLGGAIVLLSIGAVITGVHPRLPRDLDWALGFAAPLGAMSFGLFIINLAFHDEWVKFKQEEEHRIESAHAKS